ncbi:hypothetical protein GCM10010420_10840 [Streptomyces glaucosporus]|uniref:Uncharacterized protein n=1 Tax=Streptomyces glaucosporus TaxID=284044 RepID=A0ABN3HXH6_9ACTN
MSENSDGFVCGRCGSRESYLNGIGKGLRCAPCKREYARRRYWAQAEAEKARCRKWWAANRAKNRNEKEKP